MISVTLQNVIQSVAVFTPITVAQSEEYRPKSRHYALRYLRVRDHAKDIVFCPTTLQRADGLTKLECPVPQRRLLLHNVADPVIDYVDNNSDSDSDSEESDDMNPSTVEGSPEAHCAFYISGLLY